MASPFAPTSLSLAEACKGKMRGVGRKRSFARARGARMDSQHASSGEHPKIIGPPYPENKLRTILEAVGKTVAAIEYGEVESRRGMHAAEAVVFHFSDGTALSIEIGSNARDLSTSRDLTPPDVHTNLRPFWSHRARPHD